MARKPKTPLRLEYRDAKELKDNPANWRKHPAKQLDALRDAITEVGWAGAVLYNERTQRLIDGHARKALAKDKVPVLIGSWTEEQEKKILATLDPIAALAEADLGALQAVLQGVQTESEAVQSLLKDLAAGELVPFFDPGINDGLCDPDDVPAPPDEAITCPGDLWVVGDHRVLCGDAGRPRACISRSKSSGTKCTQCSVESASWGIMSGVSSDGEKALPTNSLGRPTSAMSGPSKKSIPKACSI
jgi:hypothetical protein